MAPISRVPLLLGLCSLAGCLHLPRRAPVVRPLRTTMPVGRCGHPLLQAADEAAGKRQQLESSLLLRGGEAATESALDRLRGFVDRRFFLVGVVAAVGLAALVPELGRKGGPLMPELTVNWGATGGIFLLSGLTLPSSQLAATAVRVKEHALIQAFNLAFVPLVMLAVCSGLGSVGLLPAALADGMLVMAAVPTTVNMCVALTRSAGANEALAIFNAVVGNVLGVVRAVAPTRPPRRHPRPGRRGRLSPRRRRCSRRGSSCDWWARTAPSPASTSSRSSPKRCGRSPPPRLLLPWDTAPPTRLLLPWDTARLLLLRSSLTRSHAGGAAIARGAAPAAPAGCAGPHQGPPLLLLHPLLLPLLRPSCSAPPAPPPCSASCSSPCSLALERLLARTPLHAPRGRSSGAVWCGGAAGQQEAALAHLGESPPPHRLH